MNISEIETFLTIVSTKSITRTADLLYLSQPTVSHRLRSLEKELEFPLVIRSKGFKQVELTPKGMEFVPVAERFLTLWQETMSLRGSSEQLRAVIGAADSMNTALFSPVYQLLSGKDMHMDLDIHTHQSSELYSLLNNHDIDIGFVYHKLHYKNIITERIFEEKHYLIQSDQPVVRKARIHTDELDPSRALYLNWDDSFQIWYDRWLSVRSRPHIRTDTITMLSRLWTEPDQWIIAPESVIEEFARERPLFISEIENQPPNRICYKITHVNPRQAGQKAVGVFEEVLEKYLAQLQYRFPTGTIYRRSHPAKETYHPETCHPEKEAFEE